jgi:hypothetical protein
MTFVPNRLALASAIAHGKQTVVGSPVGLREKRANRHQLASCRLRGTYPATAFASRSCTRLDRTEREITWTQSRLPCRQPFTQHHFLPPAGTRRAKCRPGRMLPVRRSYPFECLRNRGILELDCLPSFALGAIRDFLCGLNISPHGIANLSFRDQFGPTSASRDRLVPAPRVCFYTRPKESCFWVGPTDCLSFPSSSDRACQLRRCAGCCSFPYSCS